MRLVAVVLLLAPLVTTCRGQTTLKNCREIFQQNSNSQNSVYTIYPAGPANPIQVYCDMMSHGGGWTVILKRMDGKFNFYRPWVQYVSGFGELLGEHWLGLDNIHSMTSNNTYELLVEMEDFQEQSVFARYSSFSVDEGLGYVLTVAGFTDGGAGDSMSYHSRQNFSTFDKDQDASTMNCAKLHLGGFWYNNCHRTNPTGVYLWGADPTHQAVGVEWVHWKGHGYSLRNLTMKIRPVP